jgi:hypothetical protein
MIIDIVTEVIAVILLIFGVGVLKEITSLIFTFIT